MPRPLITALLAVLAAIGIAIDCEAAGAPARAASTQNHRDSLRDFTSMLESDPQRAIHAAHR